MNKRPVFDFIGLYSAVLQDCEAYFPNDRVEWNRDRMSLSAHFQSRGVGIATIDLPRLDKALLAAFESGLLSTHGLALGSAKSKYDHRPRLFWGLWSRIFDRNGCLKIDIDPDSIRLLRTLLCACKKMELECAPQYLYKATKEFYDVEARLPISSKIWDMDDVDSVDWHNYVKPLSVTDVADDGLFTSEYSALNGVLSSVQRVADRTAAELGSYDPGSYAFRHGPGAVSDLQSSEYKYSFRNWGQRLEQLFPFDQWGTTSLGLLDRLQSDGLEVTLSEFASRLIAVPKTRTAPRLIAAEPSSNQWCQQSIRDFLYSRIAALRTGIGSSVSFTEQPRSGALALQSSKSRSHATIDLSSASDRVTTWLVERIFRRNPDLLKYMAVCRTRFITNAIDNGSPSLLKLRKFSTMGSALTFPIQSIVFYTICVGVGSYLHPRSSIHTLSRQVRVYGDDLIVPVAWEPLVVQILTALFLRVNESKTFVKGNFRESCGTDAFQGFDVTPIRVNTTDKESDPKRLPSLVASSNNFHLGGFWKTAAWLKSTVPWRHLVPTVQRGARAFGFTTFSGGIAPSTRKSRWNDDLHRAETRVIQPFAKLRVVKQHAASSLLQYFTEEPDPYIEYESGLAVAGVPILRRTWVAEGDLLK
jgi:hypothetical protein